MPYDFQDEMTWLFKDNRQDKFKKMDSAIKLSDFVLTFRNVLEITLSVVHPIRGFLIRQL